MMLLAILLLPLLGGFLAWAAGRRARWIALGVMVLESGLVLALWAGVGRGGPPAAGAPWLATVKAPWIPALGASFHLGVDGLSLLMLALTGFLGLLAVLVSWREIGRRCGPYHACLLWVIGGIAGIFMALDLFLFYFLWEVMLLPMYFLIGVWGQERRIYAAVKFFLFTLAGGLVMLLAILALHFAHHDATGIHTFDYLQLLGTPLSGAREMWIMLGFFLAFAVKLPALPLHGWLPDAHTQAPTAGSVILAGLLLKTGAYGLIRFALPLFPGASSAFAPIGLWLGAAGILYGAVLAFAQTDLKRLVAYTSVSHMGFVLLGVYTWGALSLQGTIMQMICHGISTGALFIIAGMLHQRAGTRDLEKLGGLWSRAPRLGAATLVFVMASLGLPGLGNFIGEFLILFDLYRRDPLLTVLALVGIVGATIYALWLMQRTFHGREGVDRPIADVAGRELVILVLLAAAILWLGLHPRPVLDLAAPAVEALLQGGGRP